MGVNPDFNDLFRTFNEAEVRYLVVGAYAVVYHTEPRYTKDLDVWVEPTPTNARRVFSALVEFGAPLEGVTTEDFADPHLVYQIGIEPNRIDVLMGIGELEFAECWKRADSTSYGGIPIRVLAIDDLVCAKTGTGRPQDQIDVERLQDKKRRG